MDMLDFADWLEEKGYKLGATICRWSPWGILERGINYMLGYLIRNAKFRRTN